MIASLKGNRFIGTVLNSS